MCREVFKLDSSAKGDGRERSEERGSRGEGRERSGGERGIAIKGQVLVVEGLIIKACILAKPCTKYMTGACTRSLGASIRGPAYLISWE